VLTRVVVSAALGLALAAGANAARSPTLSERTAITHAMPAFVRNYPVGCASLGIQVSKNPNWARVGVQYLLEPGSPKSDPCLRYAANGFWILEKTSRWKIVFNGSDGPPCSLGLGVPQDLGRCMPG
jgi:hypothetical protein